MLILHILLGIGIIFTVYFILFIHFPILEEFKPIAFKRGLTIPKIYRMPYCILIFLGTLLMYPIIFRNCRHFKGCLEDIYEAYRDVMWEDIK